jgi:hypothetical protein
VDARVLADGVVLLHLAFVVFALLGGLGVPRWPRLAWLHLPAVGWAALVEIAGWPCPLTPLENELRRAAGAAGYTGGFLEHYALALLYPAGLTRGLQVALGAAVLAVNVAVYGWAWRRRGTVSSMSGERSESLPTWNDRLFAAVPLPPIGVASGIAAAFILLFFLTVLATGDWAIFVQRDTPWWQDRDGRLAILLALLAAYLPAARRSQALSAGRALEALRSSLRWNPGQLEAAQRRIEAVDVRGRRIAGGLGLLAIPATALLVDRNPSLYFQSGYWDAAHFWMYGLASIFTWNGGVLVRTLWHHARTFSDLARNTPEVDLLDLGGFEPFMRQGLRAALPGIVLLSFLGLNVPDRGFLWAIGVFAPLALFLTSLPLVPPLRAVHQRVRAAKQAELDRVGAAIRGEDRALRASPIGARSSDASLADLLAWRDFVESRPAWPFGGSLRLRLLIFVVIPLGSWLGGALVERLLDGLLG